MALHRTVFCRTLHRAVSHRIAPYLCARSSSPRSSSLHSSSHSHLHSHSHLIRIAVHRILPHRIESHRFASNHFASLRFVLACFTLHHSFKVATVGEGAIRSGVEVTMAREVSLEVMRLCTLEIEVRNRAVEQQLRVRIAGSESQAFMANSFSAKRRVSWPDSFSAERTAVFHGPIHFLPTCPASYLATHLRTQICTRKWRRRRRRRRHPPT